MLAHFRKELAETVEELSGSGKTKKEKTKRVNARVAKVFKALEKTIPKQDLDFRTLLLTILVYCRAVVTLELRQQFWPYNLLDFSRRVGEMWQMMCLVAWSCAKEPDCLKVKKAFKFRDTRLEKLSRLREAFAGHPQVALLDELDELTSPMDQINMASDNVFTKGGIVHVIDFKLSFNSKEKGNRNRLSEVAWAHKQRDPRTELLILVCREENNRYLDSLRKRKWQIVAGRAAYDKIGQLTGTYLLPILDKVADFRKDFSREFVSYIDDHPDGLAHFLDWTQVRAPLAVSSDEVSSG